MTQSAKRSRLEGRLTQIARELGGFLGDQAGASFVITALSFPVILGLAGLGLDAASWYADKRLNQTIADAAAVAGTVALSRNSSLTQDQLETIVWTSTADNGFVNGTHGTVTVNSPPAAGPNEGEDGFVEVLVRKEGSLYFSGMVLNAAINIETRAVGGISTFGEHCVVALDEQADGAITITGTADVTSECGLASNSSSDESILVSGNATLTAQPLQTYGDITESGSASITSKAPAQPLSERLPDPYEGVLPGLQADAGCPSNAGMTQYKTEDSPLLPGPYCGGMRLNGNIDLMPGTYILDNGGLSITGGGNITAEGVTFILTASDASDLGEFDASGGGLVTMRAPVDTAEGDYPGMLVIQDTYVPNIETTTPGESKFTGGSNMHLTGALYLPYQDVVYTGGTSGGVNCTVIVAKKVEFRGNVHLDNDATACSDAGVKTVQQTRVRILE
jgi:hypothetical protein